MEPGTGLNGCKEIFFLTSMQKGYFKPQVTLGSTFIKSKLRKKITLSMKPGVWKLSSLARKSPSRPEGNPLRQWGKSPE